MQRGKPSLEMGAEGTGTWANRSQGLGEWKRNMARPQPSSQDLGVAEGLREAGNALEVPSM